MIEYFNLVIKMELIIILTLVIVLVVLISCETKERYAGYVQGPYTAGDKYFPEIQDEEGLMTVENPPAGDLTEIGGKFMQLENIEPAS